MCERIYALAAGGATVAEMAEGLKIDVSTFYAWKQLHPEFSKAALLGKEVADDRIEDSMYSRAAGHRHPAVKIFLSKEGEVIYAPYTEILPPDTQAAKIWLNNRRADRWKDKSEVDLDADVKIIVKGGLPEPEKDK